MSGIEDRCYKMIEKYIQGKRTKVRDNWAHDNEV